MHEGRPNIVDRIANGEVQLVINTPFGQETRSDGYHIRAAAIRTASPTSRPRGRRRRSSQAIEAIKEGAPRRHARCRTSRQREPRASSDGTARDGSPIGHARRSSASRSSPTTASPQGVGLIVLHAPRMRRERAARAVRAPARRDAARTSSCAARSRSTAPTGERLEILYQVLGARHARAGREAPRRRDGPHRPARARLAGARGRRARAARGRRARRRPARHARRAARRARRGGHASRRARRRPSGSSRASCSSESRGASMVATDDGSAGSAGFVTALVERLLAEDRFDVVYVCGPEAMAAHRRRAGCAAAGVPCQVSLERLMACGVGACLSCVVTTTDGPEARVRATARSSMPRRWSGMRPKSRRGTDGGRMTAMHVDMQRRARGARRCATRS